MVQRWYRRAAAAKRTRFALKQITAACTIQANYRAYHARKKFLAVLASTVTIQAAVRGWIIRRQNLLKGTRDELARANAALRIQSVFRGYLVRKTASVKVQQMRERVAIANANYQECNTLGARTKSALEILLTHKKLTFVLNACENLEASTKLSTACCRRLVNAGAVPILFQLIRSCNRSKPHMAVMCYALQILSHLSRCKETAAVVFSTKESIGLMAEILQMYRDKEDIFGAVVSILIENCSDDATVAKISADKKIVKRFAAITNLIERKMKLASKMKSATSKTAKPAKGKGKGKEDTHKIWLRNIETLKKFVGILQAQA